MSIVCKKADLTSTDGATVVDLLNAYAMDPLGGGEPLPEHSQQNLIKEMLKRPEMCMSFIAYVDGEPAGLANCIVGFSTFACSSLLNIHDFTTVGKFRRQGVAKALLAYVANYAKENDMCKVTLECLDNNLPAKNAYEQAGFKPFELRPQDGVGIFYQKYV
jgi:ribosomal protein S18 acetylase RimI-like enzyme